MNYAVEVANLFVTRRGTTLMISPLDAQQVMDWQKMGIPLHVVCRAIDDVFDNYYRQPKRKQRPVRTIAYCAEEVEAAFSEWCEMQVGR